ncbi:hypothetical protein RDI58_015197 [Solanum bulbocastanum]|uniref:RNase H type-1 domain-containing protein n=1 Tax=Solanum bulbocastanum TaxID=147425 RepID=A0AAN8YBQ7_SOLBU
MHRNIEVNTDGDGSYIQKNNRASIGGVVRNDSGNLIMPFSVPIQCKINNQADAMADMYEVNWCKYYDLEFNSLVITDMINNKVTNYHKLKGIIRDIIKGINGADNEHFTLF